MAITKDYINSSDLSVLAAWMQANLVPAYFGAVTYADSTLTASDSDGNTLMTMSGQNIVLYVDATNSATLSSAATTVQYACTCANGALITFVPGTNAGSGMIITKTNNGVTAVIASRTNSSWATSGICRVAWGDAPPIRGFGFSQLASNQTQLVPFMTDSAIDTVSYTPAAFYIPVGQYSSIGIGKIVMDGTTYLTNGYWAVQDE